MDLLTHTLVGGALNRAGFNKWCPRAAVTLVLAANAPDIDIVFAGGGSLNYLEHHRGYTHSFAFAPVLALLVVVVVLLARPGRVEWKRDWWRMWAAAGAGILTHLLLDWTNVYGIRLMLPFSSGWHRLDITHIVDVWIWLILAMAFVAPFISKLVSAEIGAQAPSGRGAAWLALILLLAYEGGRFQLHSRAVQILESRIYEGSAPARVMAMPDPVNPLRWTGLVESADFWSIQKVNLGTEFDPAAGRLLYKPDPAPMLEIARKTLTLQRFLAFSQAPYWQLIPATEPDKGTRVEVMDLRFGAPPEPRFVAQATMDEYGRVLAEGFQFGKVLPK